MDESGEGELCDFTLRSVFFLRGLRVEDGQGKKKKKQWLALLFLLPVETQWGRRRPRVYDMVLGIVYSR